MMIKFARKQYHNRGLGCITEKKVVILQFEKAPLN